MRNTTPSALSSLGMEGWGGGALNVSVALDVVLRVRSRTHTAGRVGGGEECDGCYGFILKGCRDALSSTSSLLITDITGSQRSLVLLKRHAHVHLHGHGAKL